jgi:hypothetical protein
MYISRYKRPYCAYELGQKFHVASPPKGVVTLSRSGLHVLSGWLRSFLLGLPAQLRSTGMTGDVLLIIVYV